VRVLTVGEEFASYLMVVLTTIYTFYVCSQLLLIKGMSVLYWLNQDNNSSSSSSSSSSSNNNNNNSVVLISILECVSEQLLKRGEMYTSDTSDTIDNTNTNTNDDSGTIINTNVNINMNTGANDSVNTSLLDNKSKSGNIYRLHIHDMYSNSIIMSISCICSYILAYTLVHVIF